MIQGNDGVVTVCDMGHEMMHFAKGLSIKELGLMGLTTLVAILLAAKVLSADDLLYRYEGDVFPYDPSAGWEIFNPCETPCSESLGNGHFSLHWDEPGGGHVNYNLWISNSENPPPPPTLWVEWQFRSDQTLDPNFWTCDGHFVVRYKSVFDLVNLWGDAVISFSGNDFVVGFDVDEFHTYRFESLDGINYTFAVDGQVFIQTSDQRKGNFSNLQMGGRGGCRGNPVTNEWDFVRYGTISFGEQIVSSTPPEGFLDAREHVGLDRFTITYDSPNYIYIDDITIETTAAITPQVIATRRLDNGEPDTVEIVLDQPIPLNATTIFTFNDGVAINVIEYTFASADTDGDGNVTLSDFATFQRCMGSADPIGVCHPLDLDDNGFVNLDDYRELQSLLLGP